MFTNLAIYGAPPCGYNINTSLRSSLPQAGAPPSDMFVLNVPHPYKVGSQYMLANLVEITWNNYDN